MSKKPEYHFFSFLSRMKYINRWGLMRNTQNENIQEHSLQVGMIAHCLAVIHNEIYGGTLDANAVAVLGMYHDSNEIITGDMPTPIKYFSPEIHKAYKAVEDVATERLLLLLPEALRDVYRKILFKSKDNEAQWNLVKAADRISAYIKCLEEEKAGNREFKKAGDAILKSIQKIERPEVRYFIEHLLPSFKLTLDEMD